jgi:hypothetical protein
MQRKFTSIISDWIDPFFFLGRVGYICFKRDKINLITSFQEIVLAPQLLYILIIFLLL